MKRTNNKGITLIALIVTIIVLVIIAGISIASLTSDNGILRQTNTAKVEQIEGTAREQVKLGVSALRLAIAEASSKDNSYRADNNAGKIQAKLVEILNQDKTGLNGEFEEGVVTGDVLKISYTGDDYQNACNNTNAKIEYEITLGQKTIEITDETNATLKDQNQNDAIIDVGGNTQGGSEEEALAPGLYATGTRTRLKSWDDLVSEGILSTDGKIVSGQEANLAGDMVWNESITMIPNGAFKNCTNLTRFSIADGVTKIGSSAFYGCTGLTTVDIPDSVTTILNTAFYGCSGLTRVDVGRGVTSTGEHAFRNCSNLKDIYYHGNLEQWCNIIGTDSSNPCCNGANLYIQDELVEDIVIPNTLTQIKKYSFEGVTSLKTVTVPNSITVIDSSAFKNCTGLTGVTVLATKAPVLYAKVFDGCSSLEAIYVPADSVNSYKTAYGWKDIPSLIQASPQI